MRRGLFVLCLLAPGCDFGDRGPAPAQAIARCKDAQGDVRSHPATLSTWSPLGAGHELARGDWIQTAARAFARIEFFSGSMLEIEQSSVVVLEDDAENEAKDKRVGLIALRSGRIRGVVDEEKAKGASVAVRTAGGKTVRIAPVSGSGELDYRIDATEGGDVQLAVDKGRATVKGADGTAVTVARGEARAVKAGRPAQEVIVLPSPPEPLSAPANAVAGRAVDLRWKEEPRAAQYRVQIAEGEGFERVVGEALVEGTSYRFEPQAPGRFSWRVSAKDARGNESAFSAGEAIIASEPIPDRLLSPPDGASITFQQGAPNIAFTWQSDQERSARPEKSRYEIAVARAGAESAPPLLKETVERTAFSTRKLGPGEYRWLVYRIDGEKRRPLAPEPRRLSVKKSAAGIQLPKKLKWE